MHFRFLMFWYQTSLSEHRYLPRIFIDYVSLLEAQRIILYLNYFI